MSTEGQRILWSSLWIPKRVEVFLRRGSTLIPQLTRPPVFVRVNLTPGVLAKITTLCSAWTENISSSLQAQVQVQEFLVIPAPSRQSRPGHKPSEHPARRIPRCRQF